MTDTAIPTTAAPQVLLINHFTHELETWDVPIQIAVDDKLDEYKGPIEHAVVAWIQEDA